MVRASNDETGRSLSVTRRGLDRRLSAIRIRSVTWIAVVSILWGCAPSDPDAATTVRVHRTANGIEVRLAVCAGSNVRLIELTTKNGSGTKFNSSANAPDARRLVSISLSDQSLAAGQISPGEVQPSTSDGAPVMADVKTVYIAAGQRWAEISVGGLQFDANGDAVVTGSAAPQPSHISDAELLSRQCGP